MSNCSGDFYPGQFLTGGMNSKLTHLDVTGLRGHGFARTPLDSLPNLRVLRTGGADSGDRELTPLHHLKHLEELHLTASPVTNLYLADIIRLPECALQYIQLNDCPNVTQELVKLANSKGIVMVCKNKEYHDPSKQGMRLRFAD